MMADHPKSTHEQAPDERPQIEIAELVRRHHQEVYRYSFRLSGNAADAEDLTQQAFLQAQVALASLRDIERARSWLFTIARNCYLKSRSRQRPATESALEIEVEQLAEAPSDDAVSNNVDIDRERLQAAIDALPDPFKLVVVLFYFEDCSYKEIAQRLELPIGTVMSRLARGKKHLRAKLFEPEYHPAGDNPPSK